MTEMQQLPYSGCSMNGMIVFFFCGRNYMKHGAAKILCVCLCAAGGEILAVRSVSSKDGRAETHWKTFPVHGS